MSMISYFSCFLIPFSDFFYKYCAAVSELLICVALTPACVSALTWSFISEIKGEITSVTPGSIRAGT